MIAKGSCPPRSSGFPYPLDPMGTAEADLCPSATLPLFLVKAIAVTRKASFRYAPPGVLKHKTTNSSALSPEPGVFLQVSTPFFI